MYLIVFTFIKITEQSMIQCPPCDGFKQGLKSRLGYILSEYLFSFLWQRETSLVFTIRFSC